MSTSTKDPNNYTQGDERYVRFAQDFMGVDLGDSQKRILREVCQNQRTLIVSGNGVGKSYAVAILILAFLYTNVNSTVMGTSGSYSQFVDTMWRPLKEMWKTLKNDHGLPGRKLEGNPQIEIDDDWYAKVVSPRDPGDLEGRHANHIMVVIEEADKEYITQKHFDSAGSSITDENDRMVAVANPPEDENNVVYEKMQSPRWNVVQFSSFESHNVQFDLGEATDRIAGLTDLDTIKQDWEAWNREEWPGYEAARTAHHRRDDLDERWYRRRAGIIPPDTASAFRPFGVAEVQTAWEVNSEPADYQALAMDVARMGGDWNAICGYTGNEIEVLERWRGTDHNENFRMVKHWLDPRRQVPFLIDANAEGSGLADRVVQRYDNAVRFNAGSKAAASREYYDKWTEGLYHLGQFLKHGGGIADDRLRDEMYAAARTVKFEEKYYASRNDEVLKASSKDVIKDHLERSPDILDAAMMAVWAGTDSAMSANQQRLTW